MKLGVFLLPYGHNEGAWRHPSVPRGAATTLAHFADLARLAEEAALHFVFLNDSPSVREGDPAAIAQAPRNDTFEPLTLLSALAARTSRIGLVASATTTYNHPYHIARFFASLDHLSGGRAGWNMVTSAHRFEALNFGESELLDHDARYARGREFVRIVKGLWDSWEDDAFVRDKEAGVYVDTSKLHILNHCSSEFKVRGPLNIARPPQGYPVLVQAGTSKAGKDFAAEFAEVVFTAEPSTESAVTYYSDLKERMDVRGRDPDSLLVMPGLVPIVGNTPEEADAKLAVLQSLIPIDAAIAITNRLLGFVIDLAEIDLDGPPPQTLPTSNLMQSRQKLILEMADRDGLTVRQMALAVAASHGHLMLVGTGEQVALEMISLVKAKAADGFNILPATVPDGLRDFVELVIPELRRKGAFRQQPADGTLRDNLGLTRPAHPARTAGIFHGR